MSVSSSLPTVYEIKTPVSLKTTYVSLAKWLSVLSGCGFESRYCHKKSTHILIPFEVFIRYCS